MKFVVKLCRDAMWHVIDRDTGNHISIQMYRYDAEMICSKLIKLSNKDKQHNFIT
jgi:hypothetical protein